MVLLQNFQLSWAMAIFLATEISGPFTNGRLLLGWGGLRESNLYIINGLLMWFSFLVGRIGVCVSRQPVFALLCRPKWAYSVFRVFLPPPPLIDLLLD